MSHRDFRRTLFRRDVIYVKIRGRSALLDLVLRWTGVSWLLDSEPVGPAWFATVVLDAKQLARVIAQLDAIDDDSSLKADVGWFKDELEEWQEQFRAAEINIEDVWKERCRRSVSEEAVNPRPNPFY